jgi:hypothetical protein
VRSSDGRWAQTLTRREDDDASRRLQHKVPLRDHDGASPPRPDPALHRQCEAGKALDDAMARDRAVIVATQGDEANHAARRAISVPSDKQTRCVDLFGPRVTTLLRVR